MQHDWNAVVIYKFANEPQAPPDGSVLRTIDPEATETGTLVMEVAQIDVDKTMIGCMTCELTWLEAHGKPCPGEPLGTIGGTGEPVYDGGAFGQPLTYEQWLERKAGQGDD